MSCRAAFQTSIDWLTFICASANARQVTGQSQAFQAFKLHCTALLIRVCSYMAAGRMSTSPGWRSVVCALVVVSRQAPRPQLAILVEAKARSSTSSAHPLGPSNRYAYAPREDTVVCLASSDVLWYLVCMTLQP